MINERSLKKHIINFIIEDVHMCIYLENVSKIIQLTALEKIPGAQQYIVGLINIAGKNVPILDFAIATGMIRKNRYSIYSPVILCSNGKNDVGLIVDSVIGLSDVDISNLQMKNELENPDSPFIGSIINDNNTSLIIDINYIFNTKLKYQSGEFYA